LIVQGKCLVEKESSQEKLMGEGKEHKCLGKDCDHVVKKKRNKSKAIAKVRSPKKGRTKTEKRNITPLVN